MLQSSITRKNVFILKKLSNSKWRENSTTCRNFNSKSDLSNGNTSFYSPDEIQCFLTIVCWFVRIVINRSTQCIHTCKCTQQTQVLEYSAWLPGNKTGLVCFSCRKNECTRTSWYTSRFGDFIKIVCSIQKLLYRLQASTFGGGGRAVRQSYWNAIIVSQY